MFIPSKEQHHAGEHPVAPQLLRGLFIQSKNKLMLENTQ
jgi:hypothetical protein